MSETFKSRFGLIAAMLGMAVGTGNIWRFPRVMAANGGGAFLIPWFLFLFLWSIPLLIVEFSCGQKLRRGVLGSFAKLSHGKLTWLGGFVVFCTMGIMFYYSVVTGWCLFYLSEALTGGLFQNDPQMIWENLTAHSLTPLFLHAFIMIITALVLGSGVRKGIERVSCVLIPALFVILGILALYAMTLKGRNQGLDFIFNTDFSRLRDYKVWLEGLTQSAWSTGAGWGVALSYACYARSHDKGGLTPFTTGLGNNAIELLAVFVILPTLFTFFPVNEIIELTKTGNTGLTFIALPGLFQQMPMGRLFAILFFLGLFAAAFTSLLAMFELGVRFFHDLKIKRRKALLWVTVMGIVLGAPSALRLSFLDNQDWVWGVGLLLSGFFFALLVRYMGMRRFCEELLPIRKGIHRKVFKIILFWVIPVEFFILLIWWFAQSVTWDQANWWNPFHSLSMGTCLVQWALLLFFLAMFNKKMNSRLGHSQ